MLIAIRKKEYEKAAERKKKEWKKKGATTETS